MMMAGPGIIVGYWGDDDKIVTERFMAIPVLSTLVVEIIEYTFLKDGQIEENPRKINISGPLKPAHSRGLPQIRKQEHEELEKQKQLEKSGLMEQLERMKLE